MMLVVLRNGTAFGQGRHAGGTVKFDRSDAGLSIYMSILDSAPDFFTVPLVLKGFGLIDRNK